MINCSLSPSSSDVDPFYKHSPAEHTSTKTMMMTRPSLTSPGICSRYIKIIFPIYF